MSTPPNHYLFVAGDPSGDQHAANLVQALKAQDPTLRISALGGVHLRAVADHFLYPLVGLGGFGFWEPLFKLPALWSARRQIEDLLKTGAVKAVIPVDYYGFNIHVVRLAKQYAIPAIYYVSPQVWASRPHRIQALARALTHMLVIFPFEVALYEKAGIPVTFVGHPLLDQIPEPQIPGTGVTIGLLPGSRWSVVQRHAILLKETARLLKGRFPGATFCLFRPAEIEASRYQTFLSDTSWIELVHDPHYERRKAVTLAIGVSGTAALENTLLGIPMIVMYKLSSLTYAVAKRLIRIPFIAIPNILAGTKIVPELIQDQAEPKKIAAQAEAMLINPVLLNTMRNDLLAQRKRLGEPGAAQRAASEIRRILQP